MDATNILRSVLPEEIREAVQTESGKPKLPASLLTVFWRFPGERRSLDRD